MTMFFWMLVLADLGLARSSSSSSSSSNSPQHVRGSRQPSLSSTSHLRRTTTSSRHPQQHRQLYGKKKKKVYYYESDMSAFDDFVINCQVTLKARRDNDNYVSNQDYATMLYDHCQYNPFRGQACGNDDDNDNNNDFWTLDKSLQSIFVANECYGWKHDAYHLDACLDYYNKNRHERMRSSQDIHKLCSKAGNRLHEAGLLCEPWSTYYRGPASTELCYDDSSSPSTAPSMSDDFDKDKEKAIPKVASDGIDYYSGSDDDDDPVVYFVAADASVERIEDYRGTDDDYSSSSSSSISLVPPPPPVTNIASNVALTDPGTRENVHFSDQVTTDDDDESTTLQGSSQHLLFLVSGAAFFVGILLSINSRNCFQKNHKKDDYFHHHHQDGDPRLDGDESIESIDTTTLVLEKELVEKRGFTKPAFLLRRKTCCLLNTLPDAPTATSSADTVTVTSSPEHSSSHSCDNRAPPVCPLSPEEKARLSFPTIDAYEEEFATPESQHSTTDCTHPDVKPMRMNTPPKWSQPMPVPSNSMMARESLSRRAWRSRHSQINDLGQQQKASESLLYEEEEELLFPTVHASGLTLPDIGDDAAASDSDDVHVVDKSRLRGHSPTGMLTQSTSAFSQVPPSATESRLLRKARVDKRIENLAMAFTSPSSNVPISPTPTKKVSPVSVVETATRDQDVQSTPVQTPSSRRRAVVATPDNFTWQNPFGNRMTRETSSVALGSSSSSVIHPSPKPLHTSRYNKTFADGMSMASVSSSSSSSSVDSSNPKPLHASWYAKAPWYKDMIRTTKEQPIIDSDTVVMAAPDEECPNRVGELRQLFDSSLDKRNSLL